MSDCRELFKKRLKENGLKVTSQRLSILEVLAGCPDHHLTAEEIYDRVKARYSEIGLATVYRTIQLLLELQLIDRVNFDDGFVRYEIGKKDQGSAKHHHHHLICLECGSIVSFEDDFLDELEKRIMDTTEFQVMDHEVKFYGYCRTCRKTEK